MRTPTRARALLIAAGSLAGSTWGVGCIRAPDGAALYSKHCARCHREDGHGDPRRADFYPRLNLFAVPAVQRRVRAPIYRAIRYGTDSMPGFDHSLEHPEIEAVVSYVLTLSPVDRTNHEPPAPPAKRP